MRETGIHDVAICTIGKTVGTKAFGALASHSIQACRPMSLSLKSLRYFCAVAETGSISAAMQQLNVSQAAITESIQRLEAHLNALLFRRHARGMALTHLGDEFFRRSQIILDAVREAESVASVRPDTMSGELSIGAIGPLTGYYLPGLLARYRRNFPRVQTRVIEYPSTMVEHQLTNGELDIALSLTNALENPQAFLVAPLVHSPWRLWLPAGHRLIEEETVTLAALKHEPVIVLHNEELERTTGDLWRRYGIAPKVVARTRSVEAVRSLVATGYGLCVLPEVLYRPWSQEGARLAAKPLADAPKPIEIGLLWRKGSSVSTAAHAFIHNAERYQRESVTLGL